MTTAVPEKGLIAKLCEVMTAVDHVEKKGHTSSPGGTYDFARDVDVSNALRDELASRKVFLSSSITNVSTEVYETKNGGRGSISTVFTAHKFIDGESGEVLEFTWASQGMDGQDKGVSKGATSAIKYALLKQFLIPTGEDPDENKTKPSDMPAARSYPPRQNVQQPAQERQQEPQAAPTPIRPTGTLMEATAATATDGQWRAFYGTLKGQLGIDGPTAKEMLGIKSVKEDMPNASFGMILTRLQQIIRDQGHPAATVTTATAERLPLTGE